MNLPKEMSGRDTNLVCAGFCISCAQDNLFKAETEKAAKRSPRLHLERARNWAKRARRYRSLAIEG